MHSIVTTFREAVIKVEVANFGAAIDTLIDQDADRPSLAWGVAECKNEDCLYHECKILPREHE